MPQLLIKDIESWPESGVADRSQAYTEPPVARARLQAIRRCTLRRWKSDALPSFRLLCFFKLLECKNMAKSVNQGDSLRQCGQGPPRFVPHPRRRIVANFTLATSDRFQDAQGNWQDRNEWHTLVGFQAHSGDYRDYVKKGSKLYIEGKLQTRSWDDKESGQKRYKTEVVVFDLSLLSGREEGSSGGAGGYSVRPALPSSSASFDQRPPAAGRHTDDYVQSTEISDDDITVLKQWSVISGQ